MTTKFDRKAYNKAYQKANKEMLAQKRKEKRLANLEAAKELRRKQYHENKEYYKEYYQQTKERQAEARRRRKEADPEKYKKIGRDCYYRNKDKNLVPQMLWKAKTRANHKGIEFDLTPEDVFVPEYCPVLGVKIERGSKDCGPELDRKDITKGYVKGNAFVISGRANRLKSDATLEELRAIVKYLEF